MRYLLSQIYLPQSNSMKYYINYVIFIRQYTSFEEFSVFHFWTPCQTETMFDTTTFLCNYVKDDYVDTNATKRIVSSPIVKFMKFLKLFAYSEL